MSGLRVKETMEQIHIPEEMREQIILNVRDRMKAGTAGKDGTGKAGIVGGGGAGKAETAGKAKIGKAETAGGAKTGNRRAYSAQKAHGTQRAHSARRRAAAVAAFALAAGLAAVPVQALVQNMVRARMEDIPKERVQEMENQIRELNVEADSFSREYTDGENARMKELGKAYRNGRFPEKTLLQVDDAEDVEEGALCYLNTTGLFCLPEDRELTDEEILEIIDFNYARSYAVEQSAAAQAARKEQQEEQERLKARLQAAGGISEETAVELAANQMKEEIGAAAEGKVEIRVTLTEWLKVDDDEERYLVYYVAFSNPEDLSSYLCAVDAMDGSILDTFQ